MLHLTDECSLLRLVGTPTLLMNVLLARKMLASGPGRVLQTSLVLVHSSRWAPGRVPHWGQSFYCWGRQKLSPPEGQAPITSPRWLRTSGILCLSRGGRTGQWSKGQITCRQVESRTKSLQFHEANVFRHFHPSLKTPLNYEDKHTLSGFWKMHYAISEILFEMIVFFPRPLLTASCQNKSAGKHLKFLKQQQLKSLVSWITRGRRILRK